MDSSLRLTDEAVVGAGPGRGGGLRLTVDSWWVEWRLVGAEMQEKPNAKCVKAGEAEVWRLCLTLPAPPHLKCTSRAPQRQIAAFISKSPKGGDETCHLLSRYYCLLRQIRTG